jgi:hypothetical protein
VVSARALEVHAGVAAGVDFSLAQGRDGLVATRTEAALRLAVQVHQPALSEHEASTARTTSPEAAYTRALGKS